MFRILIALALACSLAGPAWADTGRTQEAPVTLEGGGLVALPGAADPRVFTVLDAALGYAGGSAHPSTGTGDGPLPGCTCPRCKPEELATGV